MQYSSLLHSFFFASTLRKATGLFAILRYQKNPLAYPASSAGEYLDERLREIGLKK